MSGQKEETDLMSRRSMMKGAALLVLGGAVGRASLAYPATPGAPAAGNPPPLPWPWPKPDPMEAGRRAYRAYLEKKG
jgi:hypothetical protein